MVIGLVESVMARSFVFSLAYLFVCSGPFRTALFLTSEMIPCSYVSILLFAKQDDISVFLGIFLVRAKNMLLCNLYFQTGLIKLWKLL